jgi:hypothetical protein
MSGTMKQKRYREELRRRAAEGTGHDAAGVQQTLDTRTGMARCLAAGYKVGEFERRKRSRREDVVHHRVVVVVVTATTDELRVWRRGCRGLTRAPE